MDLMVTQSRLKGCISCLMVPEPTHCHQHKADRSLNACYCTQKNTTPRWLLNLCQLCNLEHKHQAGASVAKDQLGRWVLCSCTTQIPFSSTFCCENNVSYWWKKMWWQEVAASHVLLCSEQYFSSMAGRSSHYHMADLFFTLGHAGGCLPARGTTSFTLCDPPIYSSAPFHGHKSANSCWSRRMWILVEDLIEKVESRVFTESIHYAQLWFSELLNGKLGPINQYCFSLHMISLMRELSSSSFRLSYWKLPPGNSSAASKALGQWVKDNVCMQQHKWASFGAKVTPLLLAQEDSVVLLPCTQQDDNNVGLRPIPLYDLSLTDGVQASGMRDCWWLLQELSRIAADSLEYGLYRSLQPTSLFDKVTGQELVYWFDLLIQIWNSYHGLSARHGGGPVLYHFLIDKCVFFNL